MSRWIALLFAASAVACAPPAPVAPASAPAALAPMDYERPESWLCRPDLPADACRGDLDVTELRPDGTRVVVPFVPASQPKVDCFYVYPTVDLKMVGGNHTDFSDNGQIVETTRAQVARFGEACRIFAPFYKQMTFGTYFSKDAEHEQHFEIAFADVVAAFRWYLAHADAGRRIVLVGHSQGAQMVERLLRTMFDGDAAMRSRLLVAMPIGGDVAVADGSPRGGTFQNIPLCTADDELGCVVAYNTFRPMGVRRPWPGPAARRGPLGLRQPGRRRDGGEARPLDGGLPDALALSRRDARRRVGEDDRSSRSPASTTPGAPTVRTASGSSPSRRRTVRVTSARAPSILTTALWRTKLGLHLLDMQFAQGDLVRLIERKAAVR